MNQLFNTVNYFEFQAFEALQKKTSGRYYWASRNHTVLSNLLTSNLLLFPSCLETKSRRGIPARGGFLIDSLLMPGRGNRASVGRLPPSL
jgi:hypothetical protein